MSEVLIPLDVPQEMRDEYVNNYEKITCGSGRLMLFAGDQKVEHFNDDFFGPGISEDDADPEHLFKIASEAKIGCFATQMGLIARYGMDYPQIPYLIKVNSKTNGVPTSQQDPVSRAWYLFDQIMDFKRNSGLNIPGVGYTVYAGSEFESEMLREAAQIVHLAHKNGMVSVLWMYPRGKGIENEKDPHLVAGAAGIAACIGSDFAKVNYPKASDGKHAEAFKEAIKAAGRTKVVCAGGSSMEDAEFLQQLHDQIHISGAMGNATGRNIHQKSLREAVKITNAIYAITVENASVEDAVQML